MAFISNLVMSLRRERFHPSGTVPEKSLRADSSDAARELSRGLRFHERQGFSESRIC